MMLAWQVLAGTLQVLAGTLQGIIYKSIYLQVLLQHEGQVLLRVALP